MIKRIIEQRWVSICSAHQTYDSECERCRAGRWVVMPMRLPFVEHEAGVCFGRPHVGGAPCFAIFDRFEAGETVEQLAWDFDMTITECLVAIAFEAGRRFTWRRAINHTLYVK